MLIVLENRPNAGKMPSFNPNEWHAIIDAILSTAVDDSWQDAANKHLSANMQDSCHYEGIDKKWNLDGVSLAAKLEAIPNDSAWALIYAVEGFWLMSETVSDEAADKYLDLLAQETCPEKKNSVPEWRTGRLT